MNVIKQLNLLVSFLLEIALLIIVGDWGLHLGNNSFTSIMLAIILPIIIIIIWGFFAAPKSKMRFKNPLRLIFKLSLFIWASIICLVSGHILLGIVFSGIVLINVVAANILLQDY